MVVQYNMSVAGVRVVEFGPKHACHACFADKRLVGRCELQLHGSAYGSKNVCVCQYGLRAFGQ